MSKSSRNEFTEKLISDFPIDKVFPLLCPEREHEYIPGWNANIMWSESGIAEEGAVFVTGEETWIITDYIENEKVCFVRYNLNVVTRLIISLSVCDDQVVQIWTQSQVGTTQRGNEQVEKATQEEFSIMIKGIEMMMKYYLSTGKMIDMEPLKDDHKKK